jgi:hypothetical protein
VVLKFLAPRWLGDPSLVKRFAREVRAAARLNHPNVVTIYSFHEVEGLTFYAMEYIEGRSLAQVIAREAPLEVGLALGIAAQTAEALACAHKAGILHRDIKPSNISITASGLVKVLDFGIAKILGEQTELTTDGAFLGTLSYASPEQCQGAELDARTDVYSLGVVLFEMLAGRPPHTADTPLTLIKRIVNEPPPDLEKFNPQAPTAVRRLIAQMLEKDRSHRLANGEAAAEAIRQAQREFDRGAPTVRVAPTEVDTQAQKATAPLGRPVDATQVVPRSRWRKLRKAAVWILAVWVVLAVLGQLARNANEKKAGTAPVATPTPVVAAAPSPKPEATPSPPPEVTPTPPLPTPTISAAVGWPNPTPARVTPRPPLAPAAVFSAQTALQSVPADRDLVMMFNVRSLLQSQLIRSNESKVFSREATGNLDTFFGYYGLDWRRDIDHLIVSGIVAKPETLCVTYVGRLNEASIINRLRALPGYKAVAYQGRQIHGLSVPEPNRAQSVTFLAPGIAACGSLPVLQQVCDTALGRASVPSRPVVRRAISYLDGPSDFWILGIPQPAANPALAGLDAWVLRGQLTPDLNLVGTAWPHEVKQIEVAYNLIRLIIEAWRNDKTNADLRKLGSNVTVERSADTLSLRLHVPYADLVQILDNATARGNYPFK